MKSRIFWKWSLGLSLLALPFAGGCRQNVSSPVITTNAVVPHEAITAVAAAPAPEAPTASTNAPAPVDIAEAPVQPVTTETPAPPPTIRTNGPIVEMIKLANSGVDEGVMLAFATNSPGTFNLGADEIIYLNDIGVPGSVVTAMIQRDQQLKALPAGAVAAAPVSTETTNATVSASSVPYSYASPAAAAPSAAPATALTPEQVAPQATAPVADSSATYATAAYAAPAQPAAVTYSTFYDSLSPYGTWVEVEGYGRCWQPTVVVVNSGWRPYFDGGRWVYTDCGWYWLSDYSWGWAPFHYGRWFRHHRVGWCWAPDTVWGPSWVSWRYSDAHCGWAPLPPAACYRPGAGFTYYGRSVAVSFDFGLTSDCYAFVGWNHFHHPRLHHYGVPRHQVTTVYNNTVVVNNIVHQNNVVINRGIPAARVAAATRTPVRQVAVREVTGPAHQGRGRVERFDPNHRTLTVYRPVQANAATAPFAGHARNKPAPGQNPELSAMGLGPAAAPASRLTANSPLAQPKFGPKAPSATPLPAAKPLAAPAKPESAKGHGANAPIPTANLAQNPHEHAPAVTPPANATAGKERPGRSSLVTMGRKENPAPSVFTKPPTRTAPELPAQPAAAPASDSAPAPARNPARTPLAAATPSTPAPPAWTTPRAGNSATRSERQQPAYRTESGPVAGGFGNRFNAPAVAPTPMPTPAPASPPPARPAYQAPVRAPLSADLPRYNPAPAMPPQRSYSAPVPAPAPRPQPMPSYSAPSRPMVANPPRVNPSPVAPAAPRSQAIESRPAFSAPSGPAHGAGRGQRGQP